MKLFWILVLLAVGGLIIVGCGSNGEQGSTESDAESFATEETSDFEEIKLSENQMERYIKAHQRLWEWSKEAGEEARRFDGKDDIFTAMNVMRFARKYGKNYQKALKAEGFSEEEFGKVHRTVTEIWGVLWQQKVSEAMGGEKGLSGLADQSIAMMESMLKNPNLDSETKKNLQEQIKEAKAGREHLKQEQQAQQQRLQEFDPQNVALVKENMPRLMQAWGFKGDNE